MYRNNIDVRVLVNGRPVREYSHKGLILIESRHGTNYTVKIKNDNNYRVMAILSIDGLDVLTGKPAENAKKGYIVDSYSSIEIKGYRLSDNDSASFVFTSKGKSYVSKSTGSDKNSGVIGVRVFREKEKEKVKVVEKHIYHDPIIINRPWIRPYYPWPNPIYPIYPTPIYPTPYWSGGTAKNVDDWGNSLISSKTYTTSGRSMTFGTCTNTEKSVESEGVMGGTVLSAFNAHSDADYTIANCSNESLKSKNHCGEASLGYEEYTDDIQATKFDTGTGFGKKQVDKVKKEYFEVGPLVSTIVLYYSSKKALEEMGIDFSDSPKVADTLPSAFGETNYCKPPVGWNG